MNKTHVEQVVLEFLARHNGAPGTPPLAADDNLLERALLTSMGFIELIQILEEESGRPVDFTQVDPASLLTLRGLTTTFAAT
ncbi:MAG: hypothetical protein HQL88_00590 [Magnetococcales bacterium]|nr:hypothetical protein [Magnetococcales bacterium]